MNQIMKWIRRAARAAADDGYAARAIAAAELTEQYEHWLILPADQGAGFWASSREIYVPIGCVVSLTADTVEQLRDRLDEQERRRGRPRRSQ